MRTSDAESGEQENARRGGGESRRRPGGNPAPGRPVPTPADVFRHKRPAPDNPTPPDEADE